MKARIYKDHIRGRRPGAKSWLLEPEAGAAYARDPLTGHVAACGGTDQIKARFSTREEAVAFAIAHRYIPCLLPECAPEITYSSYADNFRSTRKRPWTH